VGNRICIRGVRVCILGDRICIRGAMGAMGDREGRPYIGIVNFYYAVNVVGYYLKYVK
jgi:hypothetical protein